MRRQFFKNIFNAAGMNIFKTVKEAAIIFFLKRTDDRRRPASFYNFKLPGSKKDLVLVLPCFEVAGLGIGFKLRCHYT